MFACEMMTPFGSPVEPDVNCKKAMSSSAETMASGMRLGNKDHDSVLRHSMPDGQGDVRYTKRSAVTVESVKHTSAPHASRTNPSFASPTAIFDGSGG